MSLAVPRHFGLHTRFSGSVRLCDQRQRVKSHSDILNPGPYLRWVHSPSPSQGKPTFESPA